MNTVKEEILIGRNVTYFTINFGRPELFLSFSFHFRHKLNLFNDFDDMKFQPTKTFLLYCNLSLYKTQSCVVTYEYGIP